MIRIRFYGDDSCMIATVDGYMVYLQNLWHFFIAGYACYNWPVGRHVFVQSQ